MLNLSGVCDKLKEKGVCDMIHLFNRKELLTTASMEQQSRVRDVLAANGIAYRVRVKSNTGGMSRSRMVMPGTKMEYMYQYYIYVKKEDYEKAKFLTR